MEFCGSTESEDGKGTSSVIAGCASFEVGVCILCGEDYGGEGLAGGENGGKFEHCWWGLCGY